MPNNCFSIRRLCIESTRPSLLSVPNRLSDDLLNIVNKGVIIESNHWISLDGTASPPDFGKGRGWMRSRIIDRATLGLIPGIVNNCSTKLHSDSSLAVGLDCQRRNSKTASPLPRAVAAGQVKTRQMRHLLRSRTEHHSGLIGPAVWLDDG